jgi:8-oxo-dGTP diphosphatase
MSGRPVVDVAVGVLIRADGRFLLASRPAGKPYADYWEFPGGKLEHREAVPHALSRELHEELGIDVGTVYPWIVREFEYPHAHVRLHFCRVYQWSGVPHAREGQQLQFASLAELPAGPLLPATVPVLRWLTLPPIYGITNASELGVGEFDHRFKRALEQGLKLMLFREPLLDRVQARSVFEATLKHVRSAGGRLLVSSRHPAEWAKTADGIHLTARDLRSMTQRPEHSWVGASVHDARELAHAARIGLDFAMLGPVAATRSHPDAMPLGWSRFADEVADSPIPVYAVGGLTPRDLEHALALGAQGIALQRAVWSGDYSFGSSGVTEPSTRSETLPATE